MQPVNEVMTPAAAAANVMTHRMTQAERKSKDLNCFESPIISL